MKNSIIVAALKNTTLDLNVLADIIQSHCQVETIVEMLLGVYQAPVIPETSDYCDWSETTFRKLHKSVLVSFDPLAETNQQVEHNASYTTTKYFKDADKAAAYTLSGVSCSSGDKSEIYCFDATYTVTQKCKCSLASWLNKK